MKNALQTVPSTQTMSSVEIAKLTGKEHSKVLADIRRILDEADIGHADFGGTYSTEQNKVLACFNLPRFECDLVMSGYSVPYRMAIIKRWHELEGSKNSLPSNYVEALEALVVSEKSRQASLLLIESKDQLIIASNEASIKAGEVMVREFVKSNDLIDLGQNEFYQWMRDQNIIMEHREPYQEYVNRGYLRWKPSAEEHGGKIRHQLMITPRGKVWLAAKYMAFLDRDLAA